jgi:hypothetical protein
LSTTLNESNATIAVGANQSLIVNGSYNLFEGGGASYLQINGIYDSIFLNNQNFSSAELSGSVLFGSNDTLNFDGAYSEWLGVYGTGEVINMNTASGLAVNLLASSEATVNGNGATISLTGSGAAVNAVGFGDAISISTGISVTINDEFADTTQNIYGTNDTINALGFNNVALFGNGNTVNFLNGTPENIDLLGTGDTVYTNVAGDLINLFPSSEVQIIGTGSADDVIFGGNQTVVASSDTINFEGAYAATITGNNNIVNGLSGSTVILTSGDVGNTVSMNNGTIDLASGSVNVVGAGNNITVAAGVTVTINDEFADATQNIYGTNDTIDAFGFNNVALFGNGNTVNFLNGTPENIDLLGTGDTVYTNVAGDLINLFPSSEAQIIGTGSADDIIFGSNQTVIASADTISFEGAYAATITGNFNIVNGLTGSTVILSPGDASDVINMSDGTVSIGSQDTYVEIVGTGNVIAGAGATILSSGITTTVLGTYGYIGATNDTISAANLSGAGLNGSGDRLVLTGNHESVAVFGSDDTIVSSMGNSEFVTMTDGELDLRLGSSTTLIGSTDTINFIGAAAVTVSGNNDVVNGVTSSTVILSSSDTSDIINMNSGTVSVGSLDSLIEIVGTGNAITGAGALVLSSGITTIVTGNYGYLGATNDVITAANLSGAGLNGSGDTLNLTGSAEAVAVFGDSNVLNASGNSDTLSMWSSSDTVNLAGTSGSVAALGANDTVNIGGSWDTAYISGSNDVVNGSGALEDISASGGNEIITTGGLSTVNLEAGSNDFVNMSSGHLVVVAGITNVVLTGNNDTIDGGAGDQITVTGSNDTINMNGGGTISLSANDSGDTINMIGGTVYLSGGLSNITINGTGDMLSGPDASLAGTITQEIVLDTTYGTFTLDLTPQLVAEGLTPTSVIIPSILYQAGDIPLLISYFEGNPNLTDSQIAAAESDPNYQNDLDAYFSSADIYGSASSLPSNILAMLEGYSNFDISVAAALYGITPDALDTDLAESVYIEQQFAWATSNYPIPTDFLTADMQNLMAAVESTSTFTQGLVAEAIGLLQAGAAGASGGNQTPMLDDSLAEMVLNIAENPSFSQTALLGDEVYTPGRSGHWQIEVQGNGAIVQEEYKSPPLIETVVDDFETYVVPIVEAAAAVFQQWEVVAALSAVEAAQAGIDFAEGADLQGVFSILSAVSGALSAVGAATNSVANVASKTLDELEVMGSDLADGVGVAEGIDGIVVGGNPASILITALGGLSSLAGLGAQNYSYVGLTQAEVEQINQISEYAAVGAALGSSAESFGSGNIVAAFASLLEGAESAGINVANDLDLTASSVWQEIMSLLAGSNMTQSGAAPGDEVSLGVIDALEAGVAAGNNVSTVGDVEIASNVTNGLLVESDPVSDDIQVAAVTTSGDSASIANEIVECSVAGLPALASGLSVYDIGGIGPTPFAQSNGVNVADALAYVNDPGDQYIDGLNFSSDGLNAPLTALQTMDAFSYQEEGGNFLTAYWPGNASSGITIGQGDDLGGLGTGVVGQQALTNELIAVGYSSSQASAIVAQIPEGFFGAKGATAQADLEQTGTGMNSYNGNYSFSESTVDAINLAEQNHFLQEAQNAYTNDGIVTAGLGNPVLPWSDLPVDTQVALAYVAYNSGITAFEGTTFLKQMQVGQYQNAVENLLNWTLTPDSPGNHLIGVAQLIINDYISTNSALANVTSINLH